MAINRQQAPADQESPYQPPGPPDPLIFEQFDGIDTSTSRVGVDDKKMAWCSGFFPIGPRFLRTMPGIGPTLWTSFGPSVVFFGFANIGATPIAVVFLSDGSVYQVNTVTGVATAIVFSGSIPSPSTATTGMTQWGSQYVLIVNNQRDNGYFIWDGLVTYQAGTLAPPVTVTNTGSGYTSPPAVAASGGSGTGATFQAVLAQTGGVSSVLVLTGGQYTESSAGYSLTGGGGSGAALQLNWVGGGSNWRIDTITVVNTGSGYTSAPVLTFSSAFTVISAVATVSISSSGIVTGVTITNPGSGYAAGDTVTLGFSGGGGSGAAATVGIMPFGIKGNGIETYAQRVWIINGALLQFAAPGSFLDFATNDGGGSVTSNDSFLRVGYTRLIQTNGFLYLIGDSSINYISGVQTTGVTPTTTYTNQNADPEVGTPYPDTADVFGRNIVFANSFGAHVSYGAAVTKISDDLDGVYNTVPNFNGFRPSAAKAVVFGKKIWVLLIPVVNPVTNLVDNELFLWDGKKKWFSTTQDVSLTYIQFQEINSILTAWGTDGSRIFPLFQSPSTGFVKTVQSKLWTRPGGYQFNKSTNRFWGVVQYFDSRSQVLNITMDTEVSSAAYTLNPPSVGMVWTTASGQVMNWTTAGALPMNWTIGTTGIRVFDPQAVGQQGVLNGMTLSTSAADMAIVSAMVGQEEITAYRG